MAWDKQGQTAVWVRSLESLEARRLPGTEGARLPFWSPDGRSLGFFAGGQLMVVDLVGGTPCRIAASDPSTEVRGGTWSPNGTIVYSGSFVGPLYRVPADGSAPPEPATKLEEGHGTHRFPHFLPDGRQFLFFASTGSGVEPGELRLGELGSQESRLLAETSSAAIHAPPGHLVFARGATMLAQPFDPDGLEFVGNPLSIGIETPTGSSISGFPPPERSALRRRWANLIRRMYEVDPLVCPRCGADRRIRDHIRKPNTASRSPPHPKFPQSVGDQPPNAPATPRRGQARELNTL